MNTRRQKQIAVAFAALLVLVPVGTAVAQTLAHSATAGVTYQTLRGRWREVTVGILTFAPCSPPRASSRCSSSRFR